MDVGATFPYQTGSLDLQADRQLSRGGRTSSGALPSSREDAKIVKAGTDFESILLGSWLQGAEQSFATVPGGDGQEDEDSGKDQFQGIAMQALAGSLTASGGIGIAKMITEHLRSGEEHTHAVAVAPKPQAAVEGVSSGAISVSTLNRSP